jgi:hypothetical protein
VGGVHVFIDYTSKSAVTFDSIYFMNTVVKLEMNERKGVKYLAGRFNTTTVNSREDLILHREGTKELGNKIPALKIPFVLKENETVISYKEGGKIKYFKIAGLKKNDTDFYP